MDAYLEKIDLLRERTGVGYKEAKDALDRAEGSVVEALILLAEKRVFLALIKTGIRYIF